MNMKTDAQADEVTSGSPIFYLNDRRIVPTESSVLISSSRWLNDARIREWIATESLRRNGHDYPLLYGLPTLVEAVDQVRDTDRAERLIAEERRRNPTLDRWFEERFISTYTLDDLEKYPPGSIGRLQFDYMREHDLSPQLDPRLMADPNWKPQFDIEYYNLRSGQTHDFYHILGEVGFGVVAEYFITGVVTGNVFAHVSPDAAGELLTMNTMIMFPWMFRTMLHYPAAWPTLWRNLTYGYEIGQQSDMLFTARYEDILHLSPAEAREALGWRGFRGPTDSREASIIFGEGREIL
jgi:ubiquinone biosynthesis protein COQ4